MKEHFYDDLLNIKTRGDQNGRHKSFHYHPYEPTPYSALEKLFTKYELKSSDRLIDFGCGKGRLNFYVNHLYRSSVVGIEMNETLYQEAVENQKRYLEKYKDRQGHIHFHCCLAQEYEIDPLDNRFYFFNPFSIQIFMKIVNNVLRSVETYKRDIELILYYGSDDYIFFLENQTPFELKEEILLHGLYEKDDSERFLIYRLGY